MLYLEERAKNAQGGTAPSKPISATWLAILFGILAVGSQYHDSPYHIRTRDAQKYIQIAFHFLRIANFLLRYVVPAPGCRGGGLSVVTNAEKQANIRFHPGAAAHLFRPFE